MSHKAPQIYIACLSAYNNGKLHGNWVTVDGDVDDLEAAIAEVIKTSPEPDAEEWAIHSFEGWHGISISENPDLEELCTWAELIVEHGAAVGAYIAWVQDLGIGLDEFQDRYCGHYDSPRDFALKSDEVEERYQYSEMQKNYPMFANCIDWDHLANELELSDAYQYCTSDEEHGIYVFRYM